jgi:ribosomal protein L22
LRLFQKKVHKSKKHLTKRPLAAYGRLVFQQLLQGIVDRSLQALHQAHQKSDVVSLLLRFLGNAAYAFIGINIESMLIANVFWDYGKYFRRLRRQAFSCRIGLQ